MSAIVDYRAEQRRLALSDARDMTRRAAAAASAACAGEPDELRATVLDGIARRLLSLLEQLRALE
jgi:hypothetical protein